MAQDTKGEYVPKADARVRTCHLFYCNDACQCKTTYWVENHAVNEKYNQGMREDYVGDETWVFRYPGHRATSLPVAQVPEVFELRNRVTELETELELLKAESRKKETKLQELLHHYVTSCKTWGK